MPRLRDRRRLKTCPGASITSRRGEVVEVGTPLDTPRGMSACYRDRADKSVTRDEQRRYSCRAERTNARRHGRFGPGSASALPSAPPSVLDQLPSGETRLEVVPVGDAVAFAELPAEIDLAATSRGAEVDETLVGVFHLGAEPRDLEQQSIDLLRDRVGGPAIVCGLAPLE